MQLPMQSIKIVLYVLGRFENWNLTDKEMPWQLLNFQLFALHVKKQG